MNRRRAAWLLDGGIVSPLGLLAASAAIAAALVTLDLLGLRETTCVVSGTVPGWPGRTDAAAWLGLVYILVYSAFVLVAPVLAIGAGVLALLRLLPYD